jgi:hypothetical protein
MVETDIITSIIENLKGRADQSINHVIVIKSNRNIVYFSLLKL